MDSDEYHAFDIADDGTRYNVCKFCGLDFGSHTRTCPHGEPDDYDDPVARGKEEDRVYRDLRESWMEGP